MININKRRPESIQESMYSFPYHYLPYEDNEVWRISRQLWWGYDYLAVMDVVLHLTLQHDPQRVLDFGCGDGRLTYELAQRGINEVYGVDISERALSFARAMNLDSHGIVHFGTNVEELPDAIFDVAVAMEVLEHIPPEDLRAALANIHRVIRDTGVFIITVPTKNVPLHPKHYRHFSVSDFEQAVQGFFTIKELSFVRKMGWLDGWIRRIVINQFFTMNWRPLLRLLTALYKSHVMEADESNGSHLVAVLRKQI